MSTLDDIQANLTQISTKLTEGRDHATSLITNLGDIGALIANAKERVTEMIGAAQQHGYEHRLQVLDALYINVEELEGKLQTIEDDLGTVITAYNAADAGATEAMSTSHAVNG